MKVTADTIAHVSTPRQRALDVRRDIIVGHIDEAVKGMSIAERLLWLEHLAHAVNIRLHRAEGK